MWIQGNPSGHRHTGPKPNRYGSGTMVQAGGETMIFDCGRCVLPKAVRNGSPLKDADKLFLTHHHSDHTVGIPDLWLTRGFSDGGTGRSGCGVLGHKEDDGQTVRGLCL
jgi:ribonuclease Z